MRERADAIDLDKLIPVEMRGCFFNSAQCSDRARRYRQRQREGRKVFRVDVDESAVISALIMASVLTESEALDEGKIGPALAAVIERWAKEIKRHA